MPPLTDAARRRRRRCGFGRRRAGFRQPFQVVLPRLLPWLQLGRAFVCGAKFLQAAASTLPLEVYAFVVVEVTHAKACTLFHRLRFIRPREKLRVVFLAPADEFVEGVERTCEALARRGRRRGRRR